MLLLEEIRSKRAKQRARQPLKRDVFSRISGIVRQHHLDDGFLTVLDHARKHLAKEGFEPAEFKMKEPMELPLFSLATEKEYLVTTSILEKVENPYLEFVNSPEEILLCEYLYRLNSSIPPARLTRFHFETLAMYEKHKARSSENDKKPAD